MKVTVLGCGASWGVPAIGPDWGRCDPADPRNRRRRGSLLVESRGRAILIDTSPDLREQLIDARVSRLDAVLLTHAHADHLHGIDDLRMISQRAGHAIPFYSNGPALAEAEQRFAGDEPPAPPHWGGLRVVPDTVEFWQGRVGRLHDRLRFRREAGEAWVVERLGP